jgi:hypothetical protein
MWEMWGIVFKGEVMARKKLVEQGTLLIKTMNFLNNLSII